MYCLVRFGWERHQAAHSNSLYRRMQRPKKRSQRAKHFGGHGWTHTGDVHLQRARLAGVYPRSRKLRQRATLPLIRLLSIYIYILCHLTSNVFLKLFFFCFFFLHFLFVCFVFVFTARKSDSISQTLYVFCRCFVYAVLFLTLRGFYGGGGSHGCLLFLTVIFFTVCL